MLKLKVCTDYHAADGQHALKVEEAQSDITVVDVAEVSRAMTQAGRWGRGVLEHRLCWLWLLQGAGCEDQLVNKMSRLLQG